LKSALDSAEILTEKDSLEHVAELGDHPPTNLWLFRLLSTETKGLFDLDFHINSFGVQRSASDRGWYTEIARYIH
jgi:hypothetical protein